MKPETPSTPVVLTALWLVLAVPIMTAVLWSWLAVRDLDTAANLQRARVNQLDARALALELAPPPTLTTDTELRLGQCEAKLADVRLVLETLVRTEKHTGKARWNLEALPAPMSDWPPWPCRGEAIGSITDTTHPCPGSARPGRNAWLVTDEEAAAIRARFNGPYTHRNDDPDPIGPSDAEGLRGAIYRAGGGSR